MCNVNYDLLFLMLECKDEEQFVFYLYRLNVLCNVYPRMLRPAEEIDTLYTKGKNYEIDVTTTREKKNKKQKTRNRKELDTELDMGGKDV